MELYTQRLILRRWNENDAENLFEYAKDPDVGPIAGWPPHKSVSESLEVIKNILCCSACFAICLKPRNLAIGCIELKLNGTTDMTDRDDECELGFWLGKKFWGQGLMSEAGAEIIRYGFENCQGAIFLYFWCRNEDNMYYIGKFTDEKNLVRLLRRKLKIKAGSAKTRICLSQHLQFSSRSADERNSNRT